MRSCREKRAGLWTGMAAGMAGGLAAAFVMGFAHQWTARALGVKSHGGPDDATARAANAVAQPAIGRDLSRGERATAGQVVHFGFGTLAGGLYGAAAALAPPVSAGLGLPFGAALYLGAHSLAVPKLGLAESPLERPVTGEAVEMAAHLVYGAVTEVVRRAIVATVS